MYLDENRTLYDQKDMIVILEWNHFNTEPRDSKTFTKRQKKNITVYSIEGSRYIKKQKNYWLIPDYQ